MVEGCSYSSNTAIPFRTNVKWAVSLDLAHLGESLTTSNRHHLASQYYTKEILRTVDTDDIHIEKSPDENRTEFFFCVFLCQGPHSR